MNALAIETWIKYLGKTHEELLSKSLIKDDELTELFPGIDELYLNIEPGISMSFREESGRFERLYIILTTSIPDESTYNGELPPPYSLNMDQAEVRRLFGKPLEASGPIKLPKPIGQTGGWESYRLDPEAYPNISVVFSYTTSLQVTDIVFTLIDKGHE